MSDSTPESYPSQPSFCEKAHISSPEHYLRIYNESVKDPQTYWAEQAKRIQWSKPFTKILDFDFDAGEISWFEDGQLNASVNCLDRHVDAGHGDRVAIIWEGDNPAESSTLSYAELLREVSRFGNVLRKHGVGKGDRICLYMPMIPELAIAMLACARIGAIHSIVFGGFSASSIKSRILDSECSILITADVGKRGGKTIPLKATADKAIAEVDCLQHVFVVETNGGGEELGVLGRSWADEMSADDIADFCAPETMSAEDPLFILYTSGSTGTPKGVVHTTGGYMVYASFTHELVFDLKPEDIYWCTADIGWITGHSYIIYGPLANGATTLMFEGVPNYPDVGRFWDVVDKHQVTLFYTAPTAIRAIQRHGDEPVTSRSRQSLRLLGTVGEPINPETWRWYYDVVGDGRCPIVDTWWQTETGGIMISPLPGATPQKPGSATKPLFGIQPVLVDDQNQELTAIEARGNLCINYPWPGMMRTVWGNHERFIATYFRPFPGRYFSGDGCRRDQDGYYWITGRVDDVINVSGHRLGTAEIESALVTHELVSESAVVGVPHEIKGQGIYAFVTLSEGSVESAELKVELIQQVRQIIGPIASPDAIQFSPALPKTRSGKIMRRILRKVAEGDTSELGDTSTLADPSVIENLISGRD